IADMPAGTSGFRASGTITRDDYKATILPFMHDAVQEGAQIRLLFQLAEDFEHFSAGAMATDATQGALAGLKHLHAWHKMALVADQAWIRHTVELLGWLTPGELKLFSNAELEAAKAWVAA